MPEPGLKGEPLVPEGQHRLGNWGNRPFPTGANAPSCTSQRSQPLRPRPPSEVAGRLSSPVDQREVLPRVWIWGGEGRGAMVVPWRFIGQRPERPFTPRTGLEPPWMKLTTTDWQRQKRRMNLQTLGRKTSSNSTTYLPKTILLLKKIFIKL